MGWNVLTIFLLLNVCQWFHYKKVILEIKGIVERKKVNKSKFIHEFFNVRTEIFFNGAWTDFCVEGYKKSYWECALIFKEIKKSKENKNKNRNKCKQRNFQNFFFKKKPYFERFLNSSAIKCIGCAWTSLKLQQKCELSLNFADWKLKVRIIIDNGFDCYFLTDMTLKFLVSKL